MQKHLIQIMMGLSLTFGSVACGPDLRESPYEPDAIWSGEVTQTEVDEAVTFRSHVDELYGLPREGASSIADLIALFAKSPTGRDEPNIFLSRDISMSTDQCRGGAPGIWPELPMTIEAVVTLHPRQYMKVNICGQDERHYGTFTIEDDTGGITVLRDSRVAPFTFGDRVRIKVKGVMLTYSGSQDTRAILISDVELLEPPKVQDPETFVVKADRVVLYEDKLDDDYKGFSYLDITKVRRVKGYVHIPPTNANFNTILLTEKLVAQDAFEGISQNNKCYQQCSRSCPAICGSDDRDKDVHAACKNICADQCVDPNTTFSAAALPGCWIVGVDSELGRRGFKPAVGTHLQATGPVVNSYTYQIWIQRLGQIETIE